MMSSARGPGVIGTLMALAVMAIFVMFFIFAFDDRFQGGGKSIQSVIARQAQDIDSIKIGIAEGQKTLSGFPALIANSKELGRLKRENEALATRMASLGSSVESETAEISHKNQAFEEYKDRYRALVRGKARGETIEVLETRTGAIYKNVNIREVTAIGIQIRHEAGQKRIPFEELPEAMKDYYQFDAEQKAEALAKEQAAWNEHESAVAAADVASVQQAADRIEMDKRASKDKARQSLAIKESRIRSLDDEIKDLENAIQREGYKKISRAPQMRAQLAQKQGELSTLRADVAKLRSQE